MTAAYHALAFDHINVVKKLPLLSLFTENLIFLKSFQNENERNENNVKELNNNSVNLRSAFHIVSQWGSIKSLAYLLKLNLLELNIINKNNFVFNNENDDLNELNLILNDHIDIVNGIVLEKKEIVVLGSEKNVLFRIDRILIDGTTPLHLVARYNHINCLELFLNYGVRHDSKDHNDNTPIDIANIWGRQTFVDFLSKYFDT